MYSSCGKIEIARRVFDLVPIFIRDVVSWNSMISGYLQCDCSAEALKVFGNLLGDNCVRFDEVTLINALTASGRMGFLDLGKELHGLIIVNRFVLDVFLGSSLIDMYAKCGKMEDARKVFDKIPDRNLVCWTSMTVGYARLDMFKEGIELFREMQLAEVVADAALVASVISACGHLGALDQGRWVHAYCERNGIDMNLSVRNALIDMYSKCGEVEKARQIFNEMMEMSSDVKPNEAMPVQPDVVTWRSLLFACRSHGNIELAELATNKIEELEPRKSEAQILLSHVYASASRWGDVNRVRKCMARQKIQKKPGCSFVEINGLVHEFFAEAESLSQMDVLYETNMQIHNILRSEGFDSDFLGHQ
ncbi:hypothetical protein GH714_025188 [Hevea brasiliensis]|uniref:DYW domain-containing protein n=1 Tax=Hevea brasiliensis TaxID=3981 RepID=A0A6A6MD13_HEVBR|nr:hypothetical protein GH714_025188 [Hevea brasiliensis]